MYRRFIAALTRLAAWATPIMQALAGLPGLNGTAERHATENLKDKP